ncbi:MAG: EFR1 family ferrodoxin [Candidatus Hodarchaeota archaeon]
MKTTIFYFTGTGNSLKVAKDLSELLDDCVLIPMVKEWRKDVVVVDTEKVGFIFPMHYWGLPRIVYDFINKLNLDGIKYIFAVITRASDVDAVALPQIEELLNKSEKRLNAGYFVYMPANFIIGEEVNSKEEQESFFKEAAKQIISISKDIMASKTTIEIDPTKKKRTFEKTNNAFRQGVFESDKFFYADETCNSCGICEKVCPVSNVKIVEGKPQWQHQCVQCLACIHYCPEVSIQYGDKTIERGRYHHPAITIEDMMGQKI